MEIWNITFGFWIFNFRFWFPAWLWILDCGCWIFGIVCIVLGHKKKVVLGTPTGSAHCFHLRIWCWTNSFAPLCIGSCLSVRASMLHKKLALPFLWILVTYVAFCFGTFQEPRLPLCTARVSRLFWRGSMFCIAAGF